MSASNVTLTDLRIEYPDLLDRLIARADELHDGHLTIMKFTTNWRVCFGTPWDRNDMDLMPEGTTFEEAARKALAVRE